MNAELSTYLLEKINYIHFIEDRNICFFKFCEIAEEDEIDFFLKNEKFKKIINSELLEFGVFACVLNDKFNLFKKIMKFAENNEYKLNLHDSLSYLIFFKDNNNIFDYIFNKTDLLLFLKEGDIKNHNKRQKLLRSELNDLTYLMNLIKVDEKYIRQTLNYLNKIDISIELFSFKFDDFLVNNVKNESLSQIMFKRFFENLNCNALEKHLINFPNLAYSKEISDFLNEDFGNFNQLVEPIKEFSNQLIEKIKLKNKLNELIGVNEKIDVSHKI